MLKHLFTSTARVKLLKLFLLNPDEEYFVRELTRKLDEQINSIRRELENLQKIGILKSKNKNRKKFYIVDKQFILFNELKGIFVKMLNDIGGLARKVAKCGDIEFLLASGIFVDKESDVDLLIVGNHIDREALAKLMNTEVITKRPVKYSVLKPSDFIYRLECRDKFLIDAVMDSGNIIAINKRGIDPKTL